MGVEAPDHVQKATRYLIKTEELRTLSGIGKAPTSSAVNGLVLKMELLLALHVGPQPLHCIRNFNGRTAKSVRVTNII